MFRLLWTTILGGNPGSLAILALGVILSLGAASGSGAYIMHRMDKSDYTALQLKTEQQHTKQLQADIKALQDFEAKKQTAEQRSADLLAQLAAERLKYSAGLQAALQLAGANNADLAKCLRMPLPDGVRGKLSH
jgi:Tfp pilus assembly protein PilN